MPPPSRQALLFISGLGIHAFLMMFYPMEDDSVDYGEWKTGSASKPLLTQTHKQLLEDIKQRQTPCN